MLVPSVPRSPRRNRQAAGYLSQYRPTLFAVKYDGVRLCGAANHTLIRQVFGANIRVAQSREDHAAKDDTQSETDPRRSERTEL